MELDIQTIARRVENLKIRNASRDARMQDILAVRKGEMGQIYPDLFPEGMDKPMVANFVDVAARDLAEVLAPLPSFNCATSNVNNDRARAFADKRTLIANNYVYNSHRRSVHMSFHIWSWRYNLSLDFSKGKHGRYSSSPKSSQNLYRR